MLPPDSPENAPRPPHPLALALIERLRDRPGARVLDLGSGSGRNTRALWAAGFDVTSVADGAPLPANAQPFAGAVATHALLHGTTEAIEQLLAAVAAALESDAPFYATFGSVADTRHGTGSRLGPWTFAPVSGDEAGVAHTFFDESRLREYLDGSFVIESIDEHRVDAIVGSWAHREALRGAVHWFVRARKR